MRHSILFAFVAVAALIVAGCSGEAAPKTPSQNAQVTGSQQPQQAQQTPKPDFKTYSDDTAGYSFSYPSAWELMELPDKYAPIHVFFIVLNIPERKGAVSVYAEYADKLPGSPEPTLDGYGKWLEKKEKETVENTFGEGAFEVIPQVEQGATLGGKPARKLAYKIRVPSYPSSGGRDAEPTYTYNKVTIIWTIAGNRVYAVKYYPSVGAYDEFSGQYDDIAKSFKISG